MATNTVEEEKTLELEDRLVSKIGELGCACAVDLAGEMGKGVRPDQLIPALKALVDSGVLRTRKNDPDDDRKYDNEYQTIYEIARVR